MTCIEKLRELHPSYTNEQCEAAIAFTCPNLVVGANMPDYCPFNHGSRSCDKFVTILCWHREYVEDRSEK